MFGFFKKKSEPFQVSAPTQGELINISEVSDKVFASKMMGDGFATKPKIVDGLFTIVAPVSGEIVSLPASKHAVGIHTDNGIDVLVHIGIDTVSLNGKGFESFVKEGEKVQHGDKLIQVDNNVLAEHKLDNTVMVIFTDGYDKKIDLDNKYNSQVSSNQKLLS